MNFREQYKKETNQEIEVTKTFDTNPNRDLIEIDVWNDNYIFWLENKLSEKIIKLNTLNLNK